MNCSVCSVSVKFSVAYSYGQQKCVEGTLAGREAKLLR
jgi:hypothetical protein